MMDDADLGLGGCDIPSVFRLPMGFMVPVFPVVER